LGDYIAVSDHILAKNLGKTVYFSVRIVMNDEANTVYRTGLNVYSPEAFVADILKAETDTLRAEVCRRIAVYSEMARRCFAQN